ncbi:MAG: type II toxin-antitoxin system VapC family toxin [Burkholderiales bacterium]|nr:type II toxin-antitoxin system VapC family toxin [Burkholderiales bacterium]
MAGLSSGPVALDTNVLVRCIVADDPRQTPLAAHLLDHPSGAFIARSVLLETEWVLRAAYRLSRAAIHRSLMAVCGLPQVRLEQPEQLAQALGDFAAGMDFADALHLATAEAASAEFHTFDPRCARAAAKRGRRARLIKAPTR